MESSTTPPAAKPPTGELLPTPRTNAFAAKGGVLFRGIEWREFAEKLERELAAAKLQRDCAHEQLATRPTPPTETADWMREAGELIAFLYQDDEGLPKILEILARHHGPIAAEHKRVKAELKNAQAEAYSWEATCRAQMEAKLPCGHANDCAEDLSPDGAPRFSRIGCVHCDRNNLRTQLAEAEADRERLDWLISERYAASDGSSGVHLVCTPEMSDKEVRQAIDAARNPEAPQ